LPPALRAVSGAPTSRSVNALGRQAYNGAELTQKGGSMLAPVVQGPSKGRYLKSYEVRRAYRDAIQYPPEVPGVQAAIDIHCHCETGQQDALAVAKHASRNGMRGILYKSIVGRENPSEAVQQVQEDLNRCCEAE